jgi:tetratricopeptide (TPR) repeat protein
VVLFAGVIKTWRYVRRAEREFTSNRSNKFAFVLGSSVGLLALLVHSAADFNLQIPANALLAATLTALLSSHLRFASEAYWVGAGLGSKVLASLLLLAAAGYFGLHGMGFAREYVWLERASTKGDYSDAKIADLEKAFAAEPGNFDTAFGIGESYRVQSEEGGEDYRTLAEQATLWYSRGTNANRYDDHNWLGLGRSLDWLGRTNESRAFYDRADELDPNGYWTSAFVGRHYVQIGDYSSARPWLERSLKLQWESNVIATTYVELVNRKLLEGATNRTRVLPR